MILFVMNDLLEYLHGRFISTGMQGLSLNLTQTTTASGGTWECYASVLITARLRASFHLQRLRTVHQSTMQSIPVCLNTTY